MKWYLTGLRVTARTLLYIFLSSCIGQIVFDRIYGPGAPVTYANKFYFYNKAKSLLPITPEIYAKAVILEEIFMASFILAMILNVWYEYESRLMRPQEELKAIKS